MKVRDFLAIVLAATAGAGCVTRTHTENTALRMAWPTPGVAGPPIRLDLADKTYPASGGDIQKGSSPEALAAARAKLAKALTEALSQP
jgi:hypothetical protein